MPPLLALAGGGAGAARVTRLDGNRELSLPGFRRQALETVTQLGSSPAGLGF
ncbi:MAG: hypothetical protein KME26_12420 [Oscillatoria princeps RMCB-10]|jgi:hypothetical protein|nr:hypothetical protein [Oscillatoria princeps RMCB-10]